jgi:hypothetical protein
VRAGAREASFVVDRLRAIDGGALAAPAPPALLSRFLAWRHRFRKPLILFHIGEEDPTGNCC